MQESKKKLINSFNETFFFQKRKMRVICSYLPILVADVKVFTTSSLDSEKYVLIT